VFTYSSMGVLLLLIHRQRGPQRRSGMAYADSATHRSAGEWIVPTQLVYTLPVRTIRMVLLVGTGKSAEREVDLQLQGLMRWGRVWQHGHMAEKRWSHFTDEVNNTCRWQSGMKGDIHVPNSILPPRCMHVSTTIWIKHCTCWEFIAVKFN